ncbi:MAG: AI-2E family transporter [Bdellovibrionales bacterium]
MNKYSKWALIGLATAAFVLIFIPFYSQILLAGVFAFALDPLSRVLVSRRFIQNSKINFRRKQWVAIILVALFMLITTPISIAFYDVYGTVSEAATNGLQNSEFYADLMRLKAAVVPYVEDTIQSFNLKRQVNLTTLAENTLNDLGKRAMAFVGAALGQLPDFVLFIVVFVCALYFFLAENRHLRAALVQSKAITPQELDRIILIFQKACSSTILASVITGLVQASIVAIGSAILKTGDFFLIFVVTFFLSFVPVIGAAPVALLLCLLALVKASYGTAVGFAILAVITGSIDNVLRPYLVSGDDDVHPILVLLGLLGAITIFGLPGLFLGPVITSVTVQLYKEYALGTPDV